MDEENREDIVASVTLMLGSNGSVIIDAEGSAMSAKDNENLGRFLFYITTGAYSLKIIEILQKHFDSINQKANIDEAVEIWADMMEENLTKSRQPLVRPTEFFRGANVR